MRLKQHMCRGGIPPKIALPSSYLRLARPGKAQVFSNQCPRLVKKCYLLENSIWAIGSLSQGFQSFQAKKVEFDRLVLSPPRSPSIGVGMFPFVSTHRILNIHEYPPKALQFEWPGEMLPKNFLSSAWEDWEEGTKSKVDRWSANLAS